MLYKLLNYGVRGKIIDLIRSMYENIKSKVKYDYRLSNDFTCLLGVRQGECLSLFLFSMYVNDLGLTSWLSFVLSSVSLSLSHWYPGSGVVLDCIVSWSLQPYLLRRETCRGWFLR